MAGKYIHTYTIISGILTVVIATGSAFAAVCEDKVLCKLYGQSICTDPTYYEWRRQNCPKFCGMCPTETPQGVGIMRDSDGSPPCKDAIDNCARYGKELCDDVKFYNWVDQNCKAHCNRCSNVCEDKVPNCQDYGDTLCTDLQYYNWVQMHCRKYCARCSEYEYSTFEPTEMKVFEFANNVDPDEAVL